MKHTRNVKEYRRGQVTAIGALLFLALLILTASFLNEFYWLQASMNQLDLERINERITITNAYLNQTGHLVLNITNQGSVPACLKHLWIINRTDNDYCLFSFPENFYVKPGASISYATSFALTLGKKYSIRVATERGNIASYSLTPAIRARISIIADSTVLIGHNITVALCITNNDTSSNSIYNLTPQLNVTPSNSLQLLRGPIPSKVDLLPPGSTAIFIYIYNVTGSNSTITLNGTFTGASKGNYATTTIHATYPTAYPSVKPIFFKSDNVTLSAGSSITIEGLPKNRAFEGTIIIEIETHGGGSGSLKVSVWNGTSWEEVESISLPGGGGGVENDAIIIVEGVTDAGGNAIKIENQHNKDVDFDYVFICNLDD